MKTKLLPFLALAGVPFQSAPAAFVLLDNFDSHITGSSLASQGDWELSTGSNDASTVIVDPANANNKVARIISNNDADVFGTIYLPLGTEAIANNTTSTLFFRFYSAGTLPNFNVGLTDVAVPVDGAFAINQAQFRVGGDLSPSQLHTRNSAGFQLLGSYQTGEWHNVWVVANNTANTQSFYSSTGTNDAVLLGSSSYSFRTGTANSIQTLTLISDGLDGSPVLIDDIYISSGINTTLIPEPTVPALVSLASLALLRRRR